MVLADLQKRHLVPANAPSIKVVNTGTITKKLIFVNASASAEAKKAIEKAGGSFETLKKKIAIKKGTKKIVSKKSSKKK